ncbi:NADH dehydrogenase [ubiquinone] 1 alpha subcomplex subunit 8 isoform X1 [Vespula pensylvanica]|uniref:NADH dehydrogenase [ubiquinone] 1 alpha subcomplex subunit 8 isoform X1 n=1 Tax=Vespula pensylvanica TaxID=30213 RepID=UPI001CB9DB88|nr:NADH dehydrogenase [ubiquinone] 1 alpha subcomplex subunit 8 isoform X1 [Vespula pensylvanica]
MVVTEKVKLPDESELTVQEINLTYPILQAASFYVGKKCEWQSNEFMLCREEEKDARRCINEGKALTACALDFFKQLKKHCREDFEQYVRCIERSSGTMELSNKYCIIDVEKLKQLWISVCWINSILNDLLLDTFVKLKYMILQGHGLKKKFLNSQMHCHHCQRKNLKFLANMVADTSFPKLLI